MHTRHADADIDPQFLDRWSPRALRSDPLTPEQIATLMAHTGLGREELLQGMSDELPHAIDKLTPEGRVPTPQEMDKVIDNKLA